MKQFTVAAVIAFILALMVQSAQADDWTNKGNVYRDGVSIGTIYDVMMEKEGMTGEQATSDIKKFYEEQAIQRKKDRDQEERARKRALIHVPTPEEVAAIKAEIKRIIEEGGQDVLSYVTPENKLVIDTFIDGFFEGHFTGTPEQVAFAKDWVSTPKTLAEITAIVNEVYGPGITQDQVKFGLENASAKDIAGATTCAIKILTKSGQECG